MSGLLGELDWAIQQWRQAAGNACTPYMQQVCERTAQALEIQRDTGQAVCSCCHKPLSGNACDEFQEQQAAEMRDEFGY